MKRVVFVIGAMLLTGSLIAGNNGVVNNSPNAVTVLLDDTKKQKVDPDKLPEAVKKTLAGDDYKGWTIDVAYLVKGEKEFYQVTLKKDNNTKSVNLDKDGNVII